MAPTSSSSSYTTSSSLTSSSTTSATSSQPIISLPSNPQLTIKLQPINYVIWHAQFLPLLRLHHLIGHVDGTTPAPPLMLAYAPNHAYSAWYEHDQLVLTWITMSLSEAVMPNIINKSTAMDVWTSLTRVYASGSAVQICHLHASLHHISRGSDSAHNYLQKAKAIFDQLMILGSPVLEDELVSSILDGLDKQYRPFARNLESKLEPISF
ncbi:Retrovirus-related Pol polyprotein from transposon RE1 [Linum grandiflorum]